MTVEGGGRRVFPVVFFDGEREVSVGDVEILPELQYKPFQRMLSKKIGISPNQISIYLVDRRRNSKPSVSEDRRRLPITGKANFASICRQKDCSFLVILKRSRKSRNRRERTTSGGEFASFSPEKELSPTPARSVSENPVLLRREQETPFYKFNDRDLSDRLQSLRLQRRNYETAMAEGNANSPNFSSGHGLDANAYAESFPAIKDTFRVDSTWLVTTKSETEKAFCEECWKAEKTDRTTSFHHCVNDTVITRFATRLGPINRPNKSLP